MNKKQLIKHLRELAEKQREPKMPCHGLCRELFHNFPIPLFEECENLFSEWPKFSGSPGYPVPVRSSSKGIRPFDEYMNTSSKNMWNPQHPYGKLRLELCAFLADELEKTL